MIEVEAKVTVKSPSVMRARIRSLAKRSVTLHKIDDYYTLENLKTYPQKSLRIRKMGKIYQINFKQSLSFKHHIHAKKETEFSVGAIDDFLSLLSEFGFKRWVRKEKRSEIYTLGKHFHIELNNVKGLGWFVEVEYLAQPSEVAYAQKEVMKVLSLLGFKEQDCVEEGYTKLLWDRTRKH